MNIDLNNTDLYWIEALAKYYIEKRANYGQILQLVSLVEKIHNGKRQRVKKR